MAYNYRLLAAVVLIGGALLGARPAQAGSIGLMAAGGEDPLLASQCTASGQPSSCCTGVGTGPTCADPQTMATFCIGNNNPFACCVGAGSGCIAPTTTATRTLYTLGTNRLLAADFAGTGNTGTFATVANGSCTNPGLPAACCTGSGTGNCGERCLVWHFPMPPDYVGGAALKSITVNAFQRGNAGCTFSGVPYPCCTGSGTGTCGVLDATHPVSWHLKMLCVPNNAQEYSVPSLPASEFNQTPTSASASFNTAFAASGTMANFANMTGCQPNNAVAVWLCKDPAAVAGNIDSAASWSVTDLTLGY